MTPQPISITLPLQDYLDLACRGIEQRACVNAQLATTIRLSDPANALSHVEPVGEGSDMYWVYPIKVWRDSAERAERMKRLSEELRQKRFDQEEMIKKQAMEQEAKSQEWSLFMAKVYLAFPNTTSKLGRLKVEELTKMAREGELPEWHDKLMKKGLDCNEPDL